MAKELRGVDIGNVAELVSLLEHVRSSDEPVVLRKNDRDIAVVRPL